MKMGLDQDEDIGTGNIGPEENEGFMAAIGRLGLGEIDQEPRRLAETLKQIDEEIKTMSVKHYDVHIQNAKCLSSVSDGCRNTMDNIEAVEKNLPKLSDELSRFKQIGVRIAEAHSKNLRTLDKHVQLLELLEIPQLMDTCARNNLFDEALDLSSFASTLQKRHVTISKSLERRKSTEENEAKEKQQLPASETYSGGTMIINGIAEEVYTSAAHMRKQLLQQLRQQINLPTCLRIISFLKRLDAQDRVRKSMERARKGLSPEEDANNAKSDEIQLRFEFLDCRDSYISSLQMDEPTNYQARPYKSALKLIETCRVNWFDVITQYKPIFASGDNILQELDDDGGILARWVSGKVIDFLITLEKAIANIEDFGSLANVLEQAMKFGLSLARVGGDFRPLLLEPFKRRVFDIMIDFWHHALERAEKQIVEGDWGSPLPIPKENKVVKPPPSSSAVTNGDGNDLEQEVTVDQSLVPPSDILEFPVAAEFVNVILTSFNELRQCASPVFAMELGNILLNELVKVPLALETYKQQQEEGALPERFNELCRLFANTVLPYIQLCFDAVFDKASFSPDLVTFLPVQPLRDRILSLVVATSNTLNDQDEEEDDDQVPVPLSNAKDEEEKEKVKNTDKPDDDDSRGDLEEDNNDDLDGMEDDDGQWGQEEEEEES